MKFGIDGECNRCYLGADGSLIPFRKDATCYIVCVEDDRYKDINMNDGGHANFEVSGSFSPGNTRAIITVKMLKSSKKIIFKGRQVSGHANTITIYKNDEQVYQYYTSNDGYCELEDVKSEDILKIDVGSGGTTSLGSKVLGIFIQ